MEIHLMFFIGALLIASQMKGNCDPKTLNIHAFPVISTMPETFELKHLIFLSTAALIESVDIPSEIAATEKNYTIDWMLMALRPSLRPDDFDSLCLMRNIQNEDDGAFLSYSKKGYSIQVIDDRRLEYMVEHSELASKDIKDIANEVIDFHSDVPVSAKIVVKVSSKTVVDASNSFGLITVDRAGYSGWFAKPIEWNQSGDRVLFVFQKEKDDGERETNGSISDPSSVFGGIPSSDSRPFRRFTNPNRMELATTYLAAWLPTHTVARSPEVLGGVFAPGVSTSTNIIMLPTPP